MPHVWSRNNDHEAPGDPIAKGRSTAEDVPQEVEGAWMHDRGRVCSFGQM